MGGSGDRSTTMRTEERRAKVTRGPLVSVDIDPAQLEGLGDERTDELFATFHREADDGAGGLAICRTVAEGQGGSTGVDSRPGEGATFHFTLPDGGWEGRA
jgi:light-regulated signal transduction histidine kinase (bacteriophytochrome)